MNYRIRSWLGVSLVLFAGVSCMSNVESNSTHIRTLVVFGDSTSAPRPGIRVFASILQDRMPGVHIVNAGIAGNTTRDSLARLNRDVISYRPDVVTIFFGINDSAVDVWKGAAQPRVSLVEYSANLRQIVARVRAAGATPILLTPNPVSWTPDLLKLYSKAPYRPKDPDGWNILLRRYADCVRQIAAEEKIGLVDVDRVFRAYAAEPGHGLRDLLVDGMHPNDEGHRLIADGILQIIAK